MRSLLKYAVVSWVLAGSAAHAQTDREGTWEIGGTLLDLSSVDLFGPNGSSILVDDETGFGFTGAYNVTNRFAAGLDISYSDPAYVATFVPDGPVAPQTIGANLDVNVIHLKAIFNILESDFTPYVELGGGWTYIDSNIVSDFSGPICWWDPWWGYICTNYYETYSDTRTSWNYALGIRWESDSSLVLKASWGVMDIDRNRAEDLELDTIQLSFSWMF
jgi:hypothetical protein